MFGPYPQGAILREGMKIIRRIFPFRDAKCTPGQGRPCFNRQIGLCPGVCTGEITKQEYQKRIQNLKLFFEGRKGDLLASLEKEMQTYATKREFEKAQETRNRIFALTHIQDVSLIKEEERVERVGEIGSRDVAPVPGQPLGQKPASYVRLEGYDIAHMSGTSMVGVMTVLENHAIKKSDYRMFKIRKVKGSNDVASLKEVLSRRLNHPEWTYPTLIVMDGGVAQKSAAEEILKERGFDIAVVSVVKNERHKPENILGPEELVEKYRKEILLVNSEAHRFAIKYHRKLRGRLPQ